MNIERKSPVLIFPKLGKISMIIFSVLLIVLGFRAYTLFGYIFKPNVKSDAVVYIPTGADFGLVKERVIATGAVADIKAFSWVSQRKKYTRAVKAGRYMLRQGMNSNELVSLLRSGKQAPVRVTFNTIRTPEELAGRMSRYFESDSASFLKVFNNEDVLKKFGFNLITFRAFPIPNTYEMYWNTLPEQFLERMSEEYKCFWNSERTGKAAALGLTPVEVATLASIVQEETNKNDEKPRIAGLYMNRLKRGIPLQADPTIKFAWGDNTIRRVTFDLLEVDSPFNTYKHTGLPPGPICFPEISSLDAVLNAENHHYLFFCAREDMSGYHRFSKTLSEHSANAARYHRALNAQRIFH